MRKTALSGALDSLITAQFSLVGNSSCI